MGIRNGINRLRDRSSASSSGNSLTKSDGKETTAYKPIPRATTPPAKSNQAEPPSTPVPQPTTPKTLRIDTPSPAKNSQTPKSNQQSPTAKTLSPSSPCRTKAPAGPTRETTAVWRAHWRFMKDAKAFCDAVKAGKIRDDDETHCYTIPSVDTLFESQISEEGLGAVPGWTFVTGFESRLQSPYSTAEEVEMLVGLDPFHDIDANGNIFVVKRKGLHPLQELKRALHYIKTHFPVAHIKAHLIHHRGQQHDYHIRLDGK